MIRLRLPEKLHDKILNYYDHEFYKDYASANPVFSCLNNSIHEKISSHICKQAINRINIKATTINDIDKSRFYINLAASLTIEYFQEKDTILSQGDSNNKLFFIIDGFVEVEQDTHGIEYFTVQKKKEIKSRSRITESEQNDGIQSENQNLETDRRTTHENLAKIHQTTEEVDSQIPIKSSNMVNELKSGHYFGEITCFNENMRATATVKAVDFVTCATLTREKIQNLEAYNITLPLKEQSYNYKDKYFLLWHKMITNIREFSKLSPRSIREICFKLTKEKYYTKSIVIRFGQILDYCYFVEKGSLMVYVWNELTKTAHLFQKISGGGCVNFSNSITGHGSLFIIRTTEESVLLKLKKDDLENLAKKDHEIDEAIKFVKSKYGVNGHKYDFIHKLLEVKKSLTDKKKLLKQKSCKENPRYEEEKVKNDFNSSKNLRTKSSLKDRKCKIIFSRINKNDFINTSFVCWSTFCIIDIQYYQQNKQFCNLYQSNNILTQDITQKYILKNFREIWNRIEGSFKKSVHQSNSIKKKLSKKFTKHFFNKIKSLKYYDKVDKYPQNHKDRIDYIRNTIDTDTVLIRRTTLEFERKLTSQMKLSLPRPGTFEIQSDDLNSESWDGDDDSRSAKSVSVDLKSISEEKKEDPDDQEEEEDTIEQESTHLSLSNETLYEKILDAYKKKCILLNKELEYFRDFACKTNEMITQRNNVCKIKIAQLKKEINKDSSIITLPFKTRRINNNYIFQKESPFKIRIEDIERIHSEKYLKEMRSQSSCSSYIRMLSSN